MMDAKPRRCAGLSDLGLSVSAWPKLARSGSQRLVSVGRAQAAAAMLYRALAGALHSSGFGVSGGVPGLAAGFRGPMLARRRPWHPCGAWLAEIRTPAAAKPKLVSGFLNLDQPSSRR